MLPPELYLKAILPREMSLSMASKAAIEEYVQKNPFDPSQPFSAKEYQGIFDFKK